MQSERQTYEDEVVGHRIGWLVSVAVVWHRKHNRPSSVLFRCDCGRFVKVSVWAIRRGQAPERCEHCRPTRKPLTPRQRKGVFIQQHTSEYDSYRQAKRKMCKRWRDSFSLFIKDMGSRPEGRTLCRKDLTRQHSPDNSYWGWQGGTLAKPLTYEGQRVTPSWLKNKFGVRKSFTRYLQAQGIIKAEAIIERWKEYN